MPTGCSWVGIHADSNVGMNPDLRRPGHLRQTRIGFGIAAVDQHHLADFLHHLGAEIGGDLPYELVTQIALGNDQLDLDQLVIVQRTFDFGPDGLAEAIACHRYHRVQCVAETAQLFPEFRVEGHTGGFRSVWLGRHCSLRMGRSTARLLA